MNSEKATAVSPSSSPRARGPSVLDLLWSAAGVIAALQSKRDQPRPEDDQVPQERETAETDQFSLLARQQVMCACTYADTLIDNRFYVVFSPVVRKSHTCSFKKEATSLPARRQLKTYNYNKGFPPDSSRLGKVFPLDGRHIRGDPDRP